MGTGLCWVPIPALLSTRPLVPGGHSSWAQGSQPMGHTHRRRVWWQGGDHWCFFPAPSCSHASPLSTSVLRFHILAASDKCTLLPRPQCSIRVPLQEPSGMNSVSPSPGCYGEGRGGVWISLVSGLDACRLSQRPWGAKHGFKQSSCRFSRVTWKPPPWGKWNAGEG